MPDSEPTAIVDEALEAVVVEGYSKVEVDNGVEDFGAPKSEKPPSERDELSPVFEEIRTQGNESLSSAGEIGGQ